MKTIIGKRLHWILLLSAITVLPTSAQTTLDDYVKEGLQNNLVVQQKNISVQQAQTALAIARSNFLPSVNLLADYTSGEGGRRISLPIGDLLNPVYASLNQLTQSDQFPQVANVNETFFPYNFYDARVRTSLPIVNTDIHLNRSIQSQKVVLQQKDLDAYKRQLVQDIKVAYYQYRSSLEAISIYESALKLVNKNVEVNESLVRNGKALPANYLRSKSEVEQVKADLQSARNASTNAQQYFNFLLNRDLAAPIDATLVIDEADMLQQQANAGNQREEISMIQLQREISQNVLKMNRLSRAPKVNAFLDLGAQASNWNYNSDARYYLVGVQFSMPLFHGFRTQHTIHNSKYEVEKANLNFLNTSRQLELSEEMASHSFETALQNLAAAKEQHDAAESYFKLIDKGYQQGVNSLIEFLDARNQLTSSLLKENVRRYELLSAAARIERERALYPIQ